jgi:hypothetical protein
VGLLTIIILGESVSSLSTGLANISWTGEKLLAAATGFVMVSSIWWVYFDSFHLLTKQKLTTGHSVLYSHFFVFIGLSILGQPDPARGPGRHGGIRFQGTVGHRRGLLFHWQAVRLFHGGSRAAAPAGR